VVFPIESEDPTMRAAPAMVALLSLALCPPVSAQQPGVSIGGLMGYQGGFGVQAFATARDFAQGLPVAVRVRLGRTSMDAGDPAAARRIFINDATNGTPATKGRSWDAGLDVLVPRGRRSRVWLGVRRTQFVANFKYIGGNEDFDVRSGLWGLAGGAEAGFPMSPRMDLLVSVGAEAYFSSRLQGHDTSYSPNGENVNPRGDFTYRDADRAVGQPKLRPAFLVGVSRRLGR
jgi:hypothetical protein